jgi:hypothetical protein
MVLIKRSCFVVVAAALALATTGCQLFPDRGLTVPASEMVRQGVATEPRIRFGCYPTSTLGTVYLNENLGPHGYQYDFFEKDGVVYTCRAGHVDIIHLRIAADWTAYLIAKAYNNIMENNPYFSFGLAVDRSTNHVNISFPENWAELPQEELAAIAHEVATAMGPYLAYTMTTWHEILTWFGFKCIGFATEFPSAFSWEDSFSNLLGTILATRALEDTTRPYDEAMAAALDEEMQYLGIQPARAARRASEQVRGDWFTGSILFFVNIKKRNFDIGLDDGEVTPTMLSCTGQCEQNVKPVSYPIPTLEVLEQNGFSLDLQIEPHEWERGKILDVVYPDPEHRKRRVDPTMHFARIMDYVKKDAIRRYGQNVDAQQATTLYGAATEGK